MITPKINGSKVVIGPCRLCYVHLNERFNPDNNTDGGKYCATVLIPKTEKETLKAIKQAIEAAQQQGVAGKTWGGKLPKVVDTPLRDSDDREKEDAAFDGCFYLNAKSKNRPGVVNRQQQPITDDEEIYSGMWAVVSLSFYPYHVSGSNGVGCALNNVLKFKDDERLSGGPSAAEDFSGISFDDDDDL